MITGITKKELDKSYREFVKKVNRTGRMIFGKDWVKQLPVKCKPASAGKDGGK